MPQKIPTARDPAGWLNRQFALTFVGVFFPLIILMVANLVFLERQAIRAERNRISDRAEWGIDASTRLIQEEFEYIVGDLLFVASLVEIDENGIAFDDDKHIVDIARAHTLYDQIRLFDADGFELVRVNQNEGDPVLLRDDELQFKGDRYYFRDTIALDPGEVFVSPLDLNVERGQIETPIRPMIRFGTPLTGSDGSRVGAIVINYAAQQLLDDVARVREGTSSVFLLANPDGDWLLGPDRDSEWGFMYPDRAPTGVPVTFPDAWQEFIAQGPGEYRLGGSLFTFAEIAPLQSRFVSSTGSGMPAGESESAIDASTYRWILVSYTSEGQFRAWSRDFMMRAASTAVIYVLVALVFSLAIAASRGRRLAIERALRASSAELAESNATKDMLFSIVAHDLRGPSGAIQYVAESTLADFGDEMSSAARESVEAIEQASLSQVKLLENLLMWSRSQRDLIDSRPAPVGMGDLLRSAVDEIAERARSKLVEIVASDGDGLYALIDPETMLVVMRNLLSNAVKFTESGGTVTVEASPGAPGRIRLRVSDTGIGIPAGSIEGLFDVTNTLRREGTAGEPTAGFGLVLTRELVELNGGTISASSGPSGGSVFEIDVPAADDEEALA